MGVYVVVTHWFCTKQEERFHMSHGVKIGSKLSLSLAAAAMLVGAGHASAVTDLLVNGGFETGDLSGWTSSGAVSVVASDLIGPPTSVTILPHSGSYFAKMLLPGSPDATATLSQGVNNVSFDSATFSFAFRLASDDQTG